MKPISHLFSSPDGPSDALRTLELPGLVLPTDRLVACDPLVYFDPQPFTRTCPPGRYPVHLHLLPAENRIAYAELRLRPAAVASWELAVTAGQDPATLAGDEIFGYPVPVGLGCFIDATMVRCSTSTTQTCKPGLIASTSATTTTTWPSTWKTRRSPATSTACCGLR